MSTVIKSDKTALTEFWSHFNSELYSPQEGYTIRRNILKPYLSYTEVLDKEKFLQGIVNNSELSEDDYFVFRIMTQHFNTFFENYPVSLDFLLDAFTCLGLGVLTDRWNRLIQIDSKEAYLAWHLFNKALSLLHLVDEDKIDFWNYIDRCIGYSCELADKFNTYRFDLPRQTFENLLEEGWEGLLLIERTKIKYIYTQINEDMLDLEFINSTR